MIKSLAHSIFSIKDARQFEAIALEVFAFQAAHNLVYKQYLESLKVNPAKVKSLSEIPFLPIEFFKSMEVFTESDNVEMKALTFTSSGTTGQQTSRHHVTDVSLYEKSFRNGFELFYDKPQDYCILALLPSYLEREGSSLVYMVDDLIRQSKHSMSGFYLNNMTKLAATLQELNKRNQKTILLGVTYALLDLAEANPMELKNTIVMETGGMKGKRKEMLREELHQVLSKSFGVSTIHSEYGMTEILSQAYSKGKGLFKCPPWMQVLIRDVNDPFTLLPQERSGGINIIDLANLYSCSFIATQDLGKIHSDNSFEVLGRFDSSDLRGCNLMVE